jgi:hypothetical protein
MASFTAVDDTLALTVDSANEIVDIALSGTYDMEIYLQIELGSPGSGSWRNVKKVSGAANATIATTYISQVADERVRLRVSEDTSGTCTATLTTTSNLDVKTFKDRIGTALLDLTQKFVKFHGGIVRTSASIVNTTVALTLDEKNHAGRVVTANNTTGFAITLPEATGTGNVYTIFYGTTIGSGAATIVAPSASTSFLGAVAMSSDIAGVSLICNTGDDTITMNGTTTGGTLGTHFVFTDVASGIFMISGFVCASGNEADIFSANVS